MGLAKIIFIGLDFGFSSFARMIIRGLPIVIAFFRFIAFYLGVIYVVGLLILGLSSFKHFN